MTDRRSFLRGVITLTALAAIRPALALTENLPTIYCNHANDDWAGLQAAIDGKPFLIEGKRVVAGNMLVENGDFIISRTLNINAHHFTMRNCRFEMTRDFPAGDSVFNVSGNYVTLEHIEAHRSIGLRGKIGGHHE